MRIFALSLGRHEEHSSYVELFYREQEQVWIVARMARLQPSELHTISDYLAREMRGVREENVLFVVDVTGVGQPAINLLEEEGLSPVPAVVSAEPTAYEDEAGTVFIPKREIDSTLLILKQRNKLRFPRGLQGQSNILDRSFADFQSQDVYITGGSEKWRRGEDDDKLLALGLGCWYGEHVRSQEQ